MTMAFSEIRRAGDHLMDYVTNPSLKRGDLPPKTHAETEQLHLDWKESAKRHIDMNQN